MLSLGFDDRIRRPHVLLVTPYYWPEIAASVQLMETLAKGLSEHKFKVTVLTSSTRELISADADIGDHSNSDIKIIRAWNPFSRRSGLFNKLMEFATFFLHIVVGGLLVRKIDVIFVTSSPPLTSLPIAVLAWIKRARVVYNVQDLFPESVVASGLMSRTGVFFKIFSHLETWCYALADLVIAIDESFAEHVLARRSNSRITIIPNWVDTHAMVELSNIENKFLPMLSRPGAFIVLYAGNLGYLQNLDLLLDAANLLKEKKDILFLFVGNGNQRMALVDRVQKEGLSNCMFINFQPYEMLAHVYSACDIGVVPMLPGAGTSSIPSKTWNYLACNKPVIACVDDNSPYARLIRESRSGKVVSPREPGELVKAILEFYGSEPLRKGCGVAGRNYVVDHLSQGVAVDRYAYEIQNLLAWKVDSPMVDQGYREAGEADIPDIVQIHQAAFPGYFMTLMGTTFLERYYRLVLGFPGKVFWVKQGADGLEGFASGFLNPSLFYQEMQKQRLNLFASIFMRICTHPWLIPRLLASNAQARRYSKSRELGVCELSSIGVSPARSGQGIGKGLVKAFIKATEGKANSIILTTDAEGNDSVNAFYRSLGFAIEGTFMRSKGRRMNKYRLSLDKNIVNPQ